MKLPNLFAICVLLPTLASGGQQYCGQTPVADDLSRCPDGSIPIFKATEIKVDKPAPRKVIKSDPPPVVDEHKTPPKPPAPQKVDTDYFMGVWRTNVAGAVWESPSGYDGYNWLKVSAGLAVGDLIIKPNGTYVWNSYGGKTGNWIKGDSDYPVILLDTVENRQWQLSIDPHHTGGRDITAWDGNAYYYDGRR